MAKAKIAVTLDADLLNSVDRLVAIGEFSNRSEAIQAGVAELLAKEQRQQVLLGELAKLDIAEERSLADAALIADAPWPKY